MQCKSWLALGAAALMVGRGGSCATILGIEDTDVVDAGAGEDAMMFQCEFWPWA